MAQSVLSDGYVQVCVSSSLNFLSGGCRVLVVGQKLAAGNAPTTKPSQVRSVRDIAPLFGDGSIIAEALRKVFQQCPRGVDIWALPQADAAGAVKAVHTLTITGTATSPGRFSLYMVEADYAVNFAVETGDTPTVIGDALVAALPANFPFVAVNAAGVVTLTAKNGGTVANDLVMVYNPEARPNYAPAGVTVAHAQTTVGTGDPAAVDYAAALGECCYSCYALLYGDGPQQDALRDHLRDAWDCSKPQCFGHGYVYDVGTPTEIVATGDNSPELSRMAICPEWPVAPWLMTAAYAALSCCTTCDNPELSVQGQNNGLLSSIRMPQSCDACFSFDDQTYLRENGFVVVGPANIGSGGYTNPYIFNDVTNYLYDELGRPNVTFRDANSRRLASTTALSIATKLQEFNGVGFFPGSTEIKRGVQGTNKQLMLADIRAWAKANVGVLFGDFPNINENIQLQTDFEVAPRCTGIPGRLHLTMQYQPPVRVSSIGVSLTPQLLDNCNR
jgi:hypothetical protein